MTKLFPPGPIVGVGFPHGGSCSSHAFVVCKQAPIFAVIGTQTCIPGAVPVTSQKKPVTPFAVES
jgi:hypothetical protein